MSKNNNLITLEEFKEKNYGKRGTKKRDKLEAGYENFKIGALLQEARLEKGLTQLELADKAGVSVNHYALIERGVKNPSVTTFTNIIEVLGLKPNDILQK